MNEFFYSIKINNNEAILEDQEAIHCSKVLRKKTGDTLHITDGAGNIYKSEISAIDHKKVHCTIVENINYPKLEKLSIGVGILKNRDRMEWMVEKLVEIGIDKIFFIQSEKSERSKINLERFEKKAISAMKQSLRCYLPEIRIFTFDEICQLSFDKKFIAHCEDSQKTLWDGNLSKENLDTLLLIGPEGDFSINEIEFSLSNNFIPVSLGNFRLRTETAAIYSAAKFQSL